MYRQVLLRWHQHRRWYGLTLTGLAMTGIPESVWDSWEELLRIRRQGEQLMPILPRNLPPSRLTCLEII